MECIRDLNRIVWIKIWSCCFCLILISSCDCPEKIPITKESLANKVLYQAAENLKKEKFLYPCGSGGGMMNEIWMLSLSFFYYKQINIEEGRGLVIFAAERLTEEINAETRIHPYLYKCPFPPTHTQIFIVVKNRDNTSVQKGVLSVVSLIDGVIKYKITDPKTNKLQTIYQETYAEGLEKLKHP